MQSASLPVPRNASETPSSAVWGRAQALAARGALGWEAPPAGHSRRDCQLAQASATPRPHPCARLCTGRPHPAPTRNNKGAAPREQGSQNV